MPMTQKRILVVGGTGFLGSEIVNSLHRNGHSVKTLGRRASSNPSIEHFIGDISNPVTYRTQIAKWRPEIVVQAAWITDQKEYRTSQSNSTYANETIELANICFSSGAQHFLGLGSAAEYGLQENPCSSATSNPIPRDAYGLAKLSACTRLMKLGSTLDRTTSWARVFQPYGPSQDINRLLPSANQNLHNNREFQLSHPHQILDWISSRDVAGAVTSIIENSLPGVFDIGTAIGTSVYEVITMLSELFGYNSNLITFQEDEVYDSRFDLAVSKQSPLLLSEWKPQDTLSTGLVWTFGK